MLSVPVAGLGLLAGSIVGIVVGKPRTKRIWATVLTLEVVLGILLLYGFFVVFGAVDGSWVPLAFAGAVTATAVLMIWQLFKAKARYITVGAVWVVLVSLVAGAVARSVHDQGLLVLRSADAQVDLQLYEPFAPGTLAKSLTGESTLQFSADLPRLDGATALYPLYASFARATYPPGDYDPEADLGDSSEPPPDEWTTYSEVICSRTANAFANLLDGAADAVFLMGVSDQQREEAAARGLELELTPIGREAFVFIVSQGNPVSDLTSEQIRDIYSGQVDNWRQVGGKNHQIDAYQREEGSGSQTALQGVMDGRPIKEPLRNERISGMDPMARAVADYKNSDHAIGFSFRHYLETMVGYDQIKLLSIDGVAPTPDNIASGAYPFTVDFYAVTARPVEPGLPVDDPYQSELVYEPDPERAANAQRLIGWILTDQGQELVRAVGYVPIDG
jgi:phosphate transport system substrate-binding protein